ncbi:Hint domain-containing protein [Falsihalocynthiibacter sp. CO-5D18]|uniref:Hint domain-containing protein n=1 Tax=Falsihalocynthiibacter sp. CO-5D18 TaxID=3240872 RepID=UPI0035107A01
MKTGFKGTFVITWTQTAIDGENAADVDALTVGANWRWSGTSVRVDGPQGVLRLHEAKGSADLRKRAARMVQRLMGDAVDATRNQNIDDIEGQGSSLDNGFTVTDGRRTYTVTMIEITASPQPLLMFLDEVPPADTDLWIVHRVLRDARHQQMSNTPTSGMICFAAGTLIRTEDGPRLVESLSVGDSIQTKDNGCQQIQWIGARRMTGARLYAMPEFRPVRIRAGALNDDEPESDLLVSPNHRMLVSGPAAQLLFNTSEVLVAAKDLINDLSITIDHKVREVTYVHLMLESHQIVWANGVQSESFHPANMALGVIEDSQRAALLEAFPNLAYDTHGYGEYARRNLSASEAAILQHDSGKFPRLAH